MSRGRKEQNASRVDASAWSDALRWIAGRPRTRAEMRERLARRSHPPETIEAVVERLEREGYLDDDELAWNFIVARAERLGHGPRRLIDDLERRGLPRATARAAWERAIERGDLDEEALLRRELQRRLGPSRGPLDTRTHRRVYNALLRAGFESSAVHRELVALRGSAARSDHEPGQGFDDDFA